MFMSSITSAQAWDQKRGPVPEEVMPDASMAVGSGYGSGKYVSEKVSLSYRYAPRIVNGGIIVHRLSSRAVCQLPPFE